MNEPTSCGHEARRSSDIQILINAFSTRAEPVGFAARRGDLSWLLRWALSEHVSTAVLCCLMTRSNIVALLEGGDRRSIGRSDHVAAMVSKNPGLFPKLIAGLWSTDPIVRMRTADAAEKVTRKNPELLSPYRTELLGLLAEANEQEVRWHLAVMVPRLPLNFKERQLAMSSLNRYMEDRSSIVKTFALQGLTDLAKDDPIIRTAVIEILRKATRNGTPAMKARSRKLLRHLERM